MNETTIADTLIRLSNKLDALYDSLPQRYVPRSEFEPWRIGIESRVKSLEDNLSGLKESLHSKTEERMIQGMQALREIDKKIEQSHKALLERLEESETELKRANDNNFSKKGIVISLVFAGLGSIIAISEFIAAHFHF
jgi:hypothetical protein